MINIRIIFSILMIILLASCSQLKLQSQWHPTPEDISVNSKEWEQIPFAYHEDPAFVTGAINNDSTLSFTIRFNDPMFARLMISRGFTVWFDKEEFFGIDYMGRVRGNIQRERPFVHDSTRARNFDWFKTLNSEEFTALDQKNGEYLALSDIKNLEAGLRKNSEMFILDFTVPYQVVDSMFEGEIVAGNSINVNLHIKEMERPAKRSSEGTGRSGMSGGMRGGGRRSGGKPGGRSGMEQRPDTGSKEYKMKIILAENN